ncbi:MAG: translesion DNA synthesis-associated protein ImuA [Comamonadaceae bacterium]|nr:translesion DNA synthesis-associated protein ImuA [Burkholderiales bacterium]MEB2347142.1 translesion DNA synthesis-associated protein ImuA [Comamonadaceae bacterium]
MSACARISSCEPLRPGGGSPAPRIAWRSDAIAALLARPDVWTAGALGERGTTALPSGHAPLDAALPGGGWPLGTLIELFAPDAPTPVWPLLLPALARQQQRPDGIVALVNPPYAPYGPALAACGLAAQHIVSLRGASAAEQLWATEQALGCTSVGAVLAWLPRAHSSALRRLHLAAARRGDGLLFALRPPHAAGEASPAPLRIALTLDTAGETLVLNVLKRRGPRLAAPLHLPAQPPALRALLAASAARRAQPPHGAAQVLPLATHAAQAPHDAVDRVAVAA